MQRVVGRHKGLKFDQVLLGFSSPSLLLRSSGVLPSFGVRNFGLGKDSMEPSALKAVMGNARHLGPIVGKGGLPGRSIIRCRGYGEGRKLIRHKSRGSRRIGTVEGFSAQRLLESAAKILRNFSGDNFNNWQNLWSGTAGSHECTAPEKNSKHPLSTDAVCEDLPEEVQGLAVEGSEKSPVEFEWRSALWEAEVACMEESQGVPHSKLFEHDQSSLMNQTGEASGSAVSVVRDSEVEIPLPERTIETAAAVNFVREFPNTDPSNTGEAREGELYKASEEVDIGDLWNARIGGSSSIASWGPSSISERRPQKLPEDLQLENGQRSASEPETPAVPSQAAESPNIEIHQEAQIAAPDQPSAVEIDRTLTQGQSKHGENSELRHDPQSTPDPGKSKNVQLDTGESFQFEIDRATVQLESQQSGNSELLQTTPLLVNSENLQREVDQPSELEVERSTDDLPADQSSGLETSVQSWEYLQSEIGQASANEIETSRFQERASEGHTSELQHEVHVSIPVDNWEKVQPVINQPSAPAILRTTDQQAEQDHRSELQKDAQSTVPVENLESLQIESGEPLRFEIEGTTVQEQAGKALAVARIASQAQAEPDHSHSSELLKDTQALITKSEADECCLGGGETLIWEGGGFQSEKPVYPAGHSSENFGEPFKEPPTQDIRIASSNVQSLLIKSEAEEDRRLGGEPLIVEAAGIPSEKPVSPDQKSSENFRDPFREQFSEDQTTQLQENVQTLPSKGEAKDGSPSIGETLIGDGSVRPEKPVCRDQHSSDKFQGSFREQEARDTRIPRGDKIIAEDIIAKGDSTPHIEEMDKQVLVQNISRLRDSISHHSYLYNTLDAPIISDGAYDSLVKELEKLEVQVPSAVENSNLLVGAEPSPAMQKVAHSVPMLSLASVQKEEEVCSWFQRLQQQLGSAHGSVGWIVEPKVDGLALSLRYEDGNLKCAATRGNGLEGEDVTHNVQKLLGIPLTIPHQLPGTENHLKLLEVRGEIFMSLKHFKELNAAKLKAGERPMANPRNAAAGFMRLLASSDTKSQALSFVAYSIAKVVVAAGPKKGDVKTSMQTPKTQAEALSLLKTFGFVVNEDNRVFKTFDSALAYAKRWRDTRKSLKYEADGVVLKVNDLATQGSLGATRGDPRWAIAWKFPATEAVTILEEIELTVGRSGLIIPNARFKPVEVGGVTISRASLHNVGHVKALGLCQGDHVVVQRAGDVIPQVVHVLEELRPSAAQPWSLPEECPSCGSKLSGTSSSTMVFCRSSTCSSRHSRQVEHFAKSLIPGLGSATLSRLQEDGLVMDPADLYHLDAGSLSEIRGFAKLSTEKLLKAIEESKQRSLSSFILALGIPGVGAVLAKELEEHFGSLRALLNASEHELIRVPGIGGVTAAAVYDWCHQATNVELIHKLEEAGCKVNNFGAKYELSVKTRTEEGTQIGAYTAKAPILANHSSEELGSVKESDENHRLYKKGKQPKVHGKNGPGAGILEGKQESSKMMNFAKAAQPMLKGKTVVITGDFGELYREDMQELVKLHGGTIRTSVNSKTSFVLAGNRPGPVKIIEAENRGVPILDWESFQNLIG